MAGIFWATLRNLKERGRLLWSRPVTSWNHIDHCKQKLQIGILLINANIFSFLLILLVMELERLFLSPLLPWSLCLAGRQFRRMFSESMMETTVLQNRSHPSRQKFFEFLGTRKFQKVESVLSVSHLHSQSVGAPTVYVQLDSCCRQHCNVTLNPVGMPIWHMNSCRLCSTSRRTTRRRRRGRWRCNAGAPTGANSARQRWRRGELAWGPNVQGQLLTRTHDDSDSDGDDVAHRRSGCVGHRGRAGPRPGGR
jgi:hypothetical protein